MADRGLDPVRASFDAIAEGYASEFADELDRKPFDARLLADFAVAHPGATALDLGCGAAGHIGRALQDRGLSVTGVDFSPASIESARRLNPGMAFVVADIRALPNPDASVDVVSAFYCLIYGTDDDVVAALSEVRRVLRPGGEFLASVHGARDDRPRDEHFEEWHGIPIDTTMRYTTPALFATLVERAGLMVDELRARDPYEFEHPTRRIYVRAHVPGVA
jgi:SAM-dependent methyltransferase